MKTHELKCWPQFFDAAEAGTKPFDMRFNDRDYQVGDYVLLREFDKHERGYTGRTSLKIITSIFGAPEVSQLFTAASAPLMNGFVILGLAAIHQGSKAKQFVPVRPLTEGTTRKGGRNTEPSQVTERPPPPWPVKTMERRK